MHLPYSPTAHHATRWLPAGISQAQAQRVNRNHLRYFAGLAPMSAEDFAILQGLL